jgi:hypothetical protein
MKPPYGGPSIWQRRYGEVAPSFSEVYLSRQRTIKGVQGLTLVELAGWPD